MSSPVSLPAAGYHQLYLGDRGLYPDSPQSFLRPQKGLKPLLPHLQVDTVNLWTSESGLKVRLESCFLLLLVSWIRLLPSLLTAFLACWSIARERDTQPQGRLPSLGENPGFSVASHSSILLGRCVCPQWWSQITALSQGGVLFPLPFSFSQFQS